MATVSAVSFSAAGFWVRSWLAWAVRLAGNWPLGYKTARLSRRLVELVWLGELKFKVWLVWFDALPLASVSVALWPLQAVSKVRAMPARQAVNFLIENDMRTL